MRSCSERPVPGIVSGTLSEAQVGTIQLGRLCGAGSFGKVYRWDCLQVAAAAAALELQGYGDIGLLLAVVFCYGGCEAKTPQAGSWGCCVGGLFGRVYRCGCCCACGKNDLHLMLVFAGAAVWGSLT
jgi:hypothetical protein